MSPFVITLLWGGWLTSSWNQRFGPKEKEAKQKQTLILGEIHFYWYRKVNAFFFFGGLLVAPLHTIKILVHVENT